MFAGLWLAAAIIGLWRLEVFNSTPGAAADAPPRWPQGAAIARAVGAPTLLMFVHPQCACSRASIAELARLMASANGHALHVAVVVLSPPDTTESWRRSDLWQSAAAIPGVTVLEDPSGRESRRFGAVTSGQTVLYSADGALLFSGGITPARGHAGDSAGRQRILALLDAAGSDATQTAVFGCPLRDAPNVHRAAAEVAQ